MKNLTEKFQSLVDVFVGLNEMHIHGIMHLDIKSSNLLYFIGERLTKITDFGSARQWMGDIEEELKDDVDRIMTTRAYAPPEFLYNEPWTDWVKYRRKVDLYLVGNVIVKFFTNLSFTALLKREVSEFDDWNNHSNSGRLPHILPNLTAAAGEVYILIEKRIRLINEQCHRPLDEVDISQLITIIKELCNPIADERGHPKELKRNNNRDGLDRYRDRFKTLNRKAEYKYNKIYNKGGV